MIEETEAQIRTELRPDEKLLWSGKSKRGFIIHPRSVFLIIMILFLFAPIGGFIFINNTLHLVKVLEHLTSGESARAFFSYLVSGFFILLGLVAAWGFVYYPLQRRKTTYALTDQRTIIVSGLFNPKAKSFELSKINFVALTEPVKDKATVIFGMVDPDQYGATNPRRKQAEIDAWKRFGYRFDSFEVGDGSSRGKPVFGRFEYIEDAKSVNDMVRNSAIIVPPPHPGETKVEQPNITGLMENVVKQPGVIAFLIDVSGSMIGTKMEQAKQGLFGALKMSDNNLVGLISFDDEIKDTISIAPLAQNRQRLTEAVGKMLTSGSTALYDALKAGIEMVDYAEGGEGGRRVLVVLTDGQANAGQTRLDDIIRMTTRDGLDVRHSGGIDYKGDPVDKLDIKGAGLALPTKHSVQICYIGIGDDADMEIGRILAEATGGEFEKGVELRKGITVQRVKRIRESDIARVLEEFKYF